MDISVAFCILSHKFIRGWYSRPNSSRHSKWALTPPQGGEKNMGELTSACGPEKAREKFNPPCDTVLIFLITWKETIIIGKSIFLRRCMFRVTQCMQNLFTFFIYCTPGLLHGKRNQRSNIQSELIIINPLKFRSKYMYHMF